MKGSKHHAKLSLNQVFKSSCTRIGKRVEANIRIYLDILKSVGWRLSSYMETVNILDISLTHMHQVVTKCSHCTHIYSQQPWGQTPTWLKIDTKVICTRSINEQPSQHA